MCDMSQRSRAPSPNGVIFFSQGGKAAHAQGDKSKLQAGISMKVVNSKVHTRKRVFRGKCWWKPSNILNALSRNYFNSTSRQERNYKNINFENPQNIYRLQPVLIVHINSAYYMPAFVNARAHVSQSSLCLLDTGEQPILVSSRYIPDH